MNSLMSPSDLCATQGTENVDDALTTIDCEKQVASVPNDLVTVFVDEDIEMSSTNSEDEVYTNYKRNQLNYRW